MSRNQNGVYFLPDGNPVAPGELIRAEWANITLDDVANALTNSLDRDGMGGMRGQLKLIDGSLINPSITFNNEPEIGFFRSGSEAIGIVFKGVKLADMSSGMFQMSADQRLFLAMNPTSKMEAATKDYADMLARKLTEVVGIFGPPKTPADLPPSGLIPANFYAPNMPPAPFQMQIGQCLFYTPNSHAFIYVGSAFTPLGWIDAGEVTGEMGPQGPQGIQGVQGPAGAAGTTGETGPAGATGAQGPKGNEGPVGPEGAQGKQGSPGQTATLVGYFKNRKPSELPPNGFIPKDWDGPGNPPNDEQLREGEALIYTGGLKTDETYGHVWSFVTTAFTAAGWVDCGDIEGPEGPTGADGAKGNQGEIGPVGPTGSEGPKGDDGPAGPQGVQGIQGIAGPEGVKGDTGSQGPQGETGAQGPGGAQGPAGPSDWNAIPNIPALVYNNGGTYSINITGRAATADTAEKASATTVPASTAFSKRLFSSSTGVGVVNWNDTSNTIPGVGPELLMGSAPNGPGTENYYHSFCMEYAGINGLGNVTQMAVAYASPGNELYMRGRYEGTWSSWTRFLNSQNYNAYSPTLTGGNASGTWGINITGSAGYAATSGSTEYVNNDANSMRFHYRDDGTKPVYLWGNDDSANARLVTPAVLFSGYYDAANCDSIFVKNSGGTMTGVLNAQNYISRDGVGIDVTGTYENRGAIVATVATANPQWEGVFFQAIHFVNDWVGWRLGAENGTFFDFKSSDGNAFAPGAWLSTSDGRVKVNRKEITNALEKLGALTGYTYDRTDLKNINGEIITAAGLIAQDVEKILPESVFTDSTIKVKNFENEVGKKAVDYNGVIALLVNAVKELTSKVEALESAKK